MSLAFLFPARRQVVCKGAVLRYRHLNLPSPELPVSVDAILMLTTVPDEDVARTLATHALAARLCACVTRLGTVQSSYHWQGAIEEAQEIQLLFKTSVARAAELEQFIQAQHPYDTPEILSWPATASAAYGQWIIAETQRPLHV
jgi:periplasmic divalent cation tolerance protein